MCFGPFQRVYNLAEGSARPIGLFAPGSTAMAASERYAVARPRAPLLECMGRRTNLQGPPMPSLAGHSYVDREELAKHMAAHGHSTARARPSRWGGASATLTLGRRHERDALAVPVRQPRLPGLDELPPGGLNSVCRFIGMPMAQAVTELTSLAATEQDPARVREEAVSRYGGNVFRGRPEVRSGCPAMMNRSPPKADPAHLTGQSLARTGGTAPGRDAVWRRRR